MKRYRAYVLTFYPASGSSWTREVLAESLRAAARFPTRMERASHVSITVGLRQSGKRYDVRTFGAPATLGPGA